MVPVWEHIHFFVGFWQEKQERHIGIIQTSYAILYIYEQTLERPHERLHNPNGEF